MRKHTLIKALALLLSWITLSPLLLVFDGRWKLLPKWLRILLFVLSPMMIIVFLVVGIWAYMGYQDYWRKHHFVKSRVIENITGVRMPQYIIVERNIDGGLFDHEDTFVLEFKDIPDEAFYRDLRSKGFDYSDGCYCFQRNWGSSLVKDEVIPKGERGNYDYSMTICEKERRFSIKVMEL